MDSTPEQQDPTLAPLTLAQADEFRRNVQAAFEELGSQVYVGEDEAVGAEGSFGLVTLARKVAASGPPAVDLIRQHIRFTLDGLADTGPEASADEVVLRLQPSTLMTGLPEPLALGRAWAPGLVLSLAIDRPTSVSSVTASTAQRWETSDSDLEETGRRNLAALRADAGLPVAMRGGLYHVWESESMFTASHAIDLPTLLYTGTGRRDVQHGILFAVPSRHLVGAHVLDGGPGWVEALSNLSVMAVELNGVQPGPLSPSVYLWLDGRITQVSRVEGGRIVYEPGAHLESFLR